jgi:hypothetical protein
MTNTIDTTGLRNEIAKALGDGWSYTDTGWGNGVIGNREYEFYVRDEGKQLQFSWKSPEIFKAVITPYTSDGVKASVDTIKVAQSKSPATIAADIKRRLLPQIEAIHALYQESLDKHVVYGQKIENGLAILKEAAGDSKDFTFKANKRDAAGVLEDVAISYYAKGHTDRYLDLRLSSKSVSFDRGYLTHDITAQLFEILAARAEGKTVKIVIED